MKRTPFALFVLILAALACNVPTGAIPTVQEFPSPPPTLLTQPPAEIPATLTPSPVQNSFTYENVSLAIPAGLASGLSGEKIARTEGDNIAPWEVTSGHLQLTLDGYALQNTFHQPRIYVYPAQEYAALFEGAAESIKRLQTILADPSAPVAVENLPYIPFFNAATQVAAKIQVFDFKNGSGVRFLTQYGQDVGPITNEGLFYHFQGLTSDGKYYIIAILPINLSTLQDKYDAPVPEGGVPFPNFNDPNPDFQGYYKQVANMLDITLAGAFTPHLENLDFMIQSLTVNP